jgi:hypothetical protein
MIFFVTKMNEEKFQINVSNVLVLKAREGEWIIYLFVNVMLILINIY